MYARFHKSYYGYDSFETLNVGFFLQYGPFVIIDCSRQNELIKIVTMDVRIEFECRDYVCEYYRLTHLTRSRDRILPIDQYSAQDSVNYNVDKYLYSFLYKSRNVLRWGAIKKLFVMVAPTFVDLQGFTVGRRFVVKWRC